MKDEKFTTIEENVVLALLSRPQFRRWAGLPEKGPLTLQQIADCLDVSPQTIQGIEYTGRYPDCPGGGRGEPPAQIRHRPGGNGRPGRDECCAGRAAAWQAIARPESRHRSRRVGETL